MFLIELLNICNEYRIEKLESMYQSYSNELTTIAICVSLFGVIFAVIIFIFGYYEPNKLMTEMREIKSKMEGYENKIKQLDELTIKYNHVERDVLRSLYEGSKDKGSWKFIWSIRYSYWFYKHNDIKGLKIRIEQALKDFEGVDVANREKFKEPEINKELKGKIHDLETCDDKDVKKFAEEILIRFYTA